MSEKGHTGQKVVNTELLERRERRKSNRFICALVQENKQPVGWREKDLVIYEIDEQTICSRQKKRLTLGL